VGLKLHQDIILSGTEKMREKVVGVRAKKANEGLVCIEFCRPLEFVLFCMK
jgi:hypothetical protein